MIKSKRQMSIIIGVFALVLMLGTITYAFFNYTRTGTGNNIRVGRISFNSSQDGSINLTNVFPITSAEAETDTTNAKSLSVSITGDADYTGGVEYLVSASNVNMTVGGKNLPISLEIDIAGNNSKTLGTLENDNYYANRESYSVSKYKIEYNGELKEGSHLLVGFIAPNTTSGIVDGVDGIINIKAYIDASRVLISDTYDGSESDNMGTPNSMAEGKTVFTTTEWNSIQNTPLSFKIKVEANEGIWVNDPSETPATCFTYIESDDDITITDYDKTCGKNVVIPRKINNKPVKTIGNNSMEKAGLTSVIIPDTVEKIGETAFRENNLTSIVVPDSVKIIGPYSFAENQLEEVTIGRNVEEIGRGSLLVHKEYDSNLSLSLVVNKSITVIDCDEVFWFTPSVDLDHHHILMAGDYTIGTQVIHITNEYAACYSISDAVLFDYNTACGSDVIIPNGIRVIDAGALDDKGLTSVSIPNSVTTIMSWAFSNNNLTGITIPSSVTEIEEGVFSNNNLTGITIPSSVTEIGQEAFSNNNLTSLTIPSSVTSVDEFAFMGNNITTLIIPNDVQDLFVWHDVIVPEDITNLEIDISTIPSDFSILYNLDCLEAITIGSHVQTIGSQAFYTHVKENEEDYEYNLTLSTVVNQTGRAFDWKNVFLGQNGTPAITGTVSYGVGTVTVTSE